MESHEVIRQAVDGPGVKKVASDLRVSSALVYKWFHPAPEKGAGGDASGTRNPLDRVAALYRATGDIRIIGWLCARAGGFFTENPERIDRPTRRFVAELQRLIKEFSDVIAASTKSFDDDMAIDTKEAKRIRREWEELKSAAESFCVACEKGIFRARRNRNR